MARRAGPKHSTSVEETYARGRMGALAALATLALVGTGAAGAFAATTIPQSDATSEDAPAVAMVADDADTPAVITEEPADPDPTPTPAPAPEVTTPTDTPAPTPTETSKPAGEVSTTTDQPQTDTTTDEAGVQSLKAEIMPLASSTTMDVVVRKRVIANPSGLSSAVMSNIGSVYSYTEGAVFRLYTNVSSAPGVAVTESWATCTIPANSGTCTITIPQANVESGNRGKRFWVVEEKPIPGSPAANTYSNPILYVGDYNNPQYARRLVGLTQAVAVNRINYMPMTATGVNGGTIISNDERPAGSSATVAESGSFGAMANSYLNPDIEPKCLTQHPKIAIVIDESSSISQSDWTTFRTALVGSGNDSVLGVVQDKAAVSILGFGLGSYWRYGSGGPVLVTALNRTAIANSVPERRPARIGTNWDAALSTIQDVNASHQYDMVLFVTDGAPNAILGGVDQAGTIVTGMVQGTGYQVAIRALEAPIYAANALKVEGVRVVAVGVGDGAISNQVAANLRAITGETKNEDYFQGSWSELNAILADVMKTATCTVPIEVTKTTVDGSTTVQRAGGWEFRAAKEGAGTLTGPTPANGTTVTNGSVTWDLSFADTTSKADLDLTELPTLPQVQAGWALTDVECTVNGAPRAVSFENGKVQITGLGAASGKVACNFTNTKAQTGALAITKAFDGSVPRGSGTSTVFNGTYTCTKGGSTVASGNWSHTGTGTATLTPADGSPAANAIPAGASCSATENQPTGSGGLPNSSWEWDTYSVTDPVTIASNQTGTLTVTNKAKRVYGDFSVKKVVPEGSVVAEGMEFSGNWSCTLGTETPVTGTWGPIAAGATWTSDDAEDEIPLGANCTVVGEDREDYPAAGYVWDGEPDISDDVTAEAQDPKVITVTNKTKAIVGPDLPLTGGISRDAFIIGGLSVLVLGLGTAGTIQFRNRRKEVA